MSILIRGMEMPKKCGQCKLFHAEHPMYCTADESHRTVGAPYGMPRPDWCPLIDIPTPHGRLIDADELVRIWTGAKFYGNIKPIVDARPTVIEAEGETE